MYLKDLVNYISLFNNCQPYIINPQNMSYGKTLTAKSPESECYLLLLRFRPVLRKGWRTSPWAQDYLTIKGQKKICERMLDRFNLVNFFDFQFLSLPNLHSSNHQLLITCPNSLRDNRFHPPGPPNLSC